MDQGLQREIYEERRRKWRRSGFWRGVFLTLALALVLTGGLWLLGRAPGGAHIAVLRIDGMIAQDDLREEVLGQVAKDPTAHALVVRISSPGGTVVGSEQLFHAIRGVADAKPVVAVMGEMATSGGLIAALAADHVFARETTLTGSIGVVLEYPDFSVLLDDIGVKVEVVRAPAAKGDPSPFRPTSEAARAALDLVAADAAGWFRALVAERRGFDAAALEQVATGVPFGGRRALELGLIDALGGISEARAYLAARDPALEDLPLRELDVDDEDAFAAVLPGAGATWAAFRRLLALGQEGVAAGVAGGAMAPRLWAVTP